jgi:hypothetical protein
MLEKRCNYGAGSLSAACDPQFVSSFGVGDFSSESSPRAVKWISSMTLMMINLWRGELL